jgi:hypothetical protein
MAHRKKMSLKDRAAFARRMARARARKHPKKRNAARKHHKPRTTHTAHKKHNRAAAKRSHRPRTKPKARRKNPGEIISLVLPGMAGNPAHKKGKSMAATKKHKKKASAHKKHNAGRPRHHTTRKMSHHRRRHNPAGFAMRDILWLGAGAVVAPPVTGAATQMILGASNTGALGYAVNLAATGLLAWIANMFVKNRAFAAGILAGGVGSVMRRVISDYTPYGSFLAGSGVGDYMIQNSAVMQRLPDALSSAQVENPGGPWAQAAPTPVSSAGVADYYGSLGY